MVGAKVSIMALCTAVNHGAESQKQTGQFSHLWGLTLFVHCTVPKTPNNLINLTRANSLRRLSAC